MELLLMTIYLPCLDESNNQFPPVENALSEPNGLLAFGGNLHPTTLIKAYQNGIFPWYSDDDPILWWSPTLRAVIKPDCFKPAKSLRKHFKKSNWQVTLNQATSQVIELCASTRTPEETWITREMQNAYIELARLGHCHSVEVWESQQLIGGLYGVKIGKIFCGESMFSLKSNASKVAFWHLCVHFNQVGGLLIDCQMMNDHLKTLGVTEVSRAYFIRQLEQYRHQDVDLHGFNTQQLLIPSI